MPERIAIGAPISLAGADAPHFENYEVAMRRIAMQNGCIDELPVSDVGLSGGMMFAARWLEFLECSV